MSDWGSAASGFKHLDKFYIDGAWVEPSSSATISVVSPINEEVFIRVAEAQEADVNRAVAAAREAFDNGPWPRMSHAERAHYMRRFHEIAERRREELARIHANQMGVTFPMAMMLADAGLWSYYASLSETFPFVERHTPGSGNVGLLVREPVGVVGAIIPWNGPFGLIGAKSAPALIAGCTVVVKASPEAPGEAYIAAEIMEEIGMPPGVWNFLTADREVSEALVRHPDVDKITFTGSTAAGKKIASICGGRIARCTLELGGKSPAVVLDDYDIGTAAQSIAAMAPIMTGQVCASLTRIIVPRTKHDQMVEALSAEFDKLVVGDPFAEGTQMGPLAMSRQRDRVENYIARGQSEGAVLAQGGSRPVHLNRGYYIEPTVFGNVTNDMVIAREEIFGPVLSVIAADSEEQAITIANDSDFGLNASVFTNDIDRAYAASRRIRSGTVGHNMFRSDFSIAFGGFKQSGIGREGGLEGLHPFLETKTVILDAEPQALTEVA